MYGALLSILLTAISNLPDSAKGIDFCSRLAVRVARQVVLSREVCEGVGPSQLNGDAVEGASCLLFHAERPQMNLLQTAQALSQSSASCEAV